MTQVSLFSYHFGHSTQTDEWVLKRYRRRGGTVLLNYLAAAEVAVTIFLVVQ